MNKLEKYKEEFLKKAWLEKTYGPTSTSYGFDAAIALDLPIKFAKWLRSNISLTDGESYSKSWIVIGLNISCKEENFPTEEELYLYWLNNVYKPE